MSGQTIRDLVIKIRMEQAGPTKLRAPDTTEWQKAVGDAQRNVQKAVGDSNPAVDPSTKNAERNVDRATVGNDRYDRQAREAEKAYDREAAAALRAYDRIMRERERAANAAEREYDREARAAINAYSKITRERERAKDAAEREARQTAYAVNRSFNASLNDRTGLGGGRRQRPDEEAVEQSRNAGIMRDAATKQRLEAYSQIGEGALRAGRGIAFLTAASEEDIRVAMQYVAAVQGVFDVFAGLAGVTKGLVSIRQANISTAKAMAATEAVAATSVTALATAETGATTATLSLNAAMLANPLTAAAVAVIATGAAAWIAYSQAVAEAKRQEELLNKAFMDRSKDELENRDRLFSKLSIELEGRKELAAATMGKSSFDDQMRELEMQAADAKRLRDAAPDLRSPLSDRPRIEPTYGMFGNQTNTADVEKQAQEELDDINSRKEQFLNSKLGSSQAEADNRRQILGLLDAETERLQQHNVLAINNRDIQKQAVETAKQAMATEEERFGRLSKGEQERLKAINARLAAGEKLNRQEAEFLDQSGFGREQTSRFFREEGKAAGATAGLSELSSAQKEYSQRLQDLKNSEATLGQVSKDVTKALEEIAQQRLKVLKELMDAIKSGTATKTEVDVIRREIEEIKQRNIKRDLK